MKKLFIAGIISILACSVNAASFNSEVAITPAQAEVVDMYTAPLCAAKSPKIVKRGERVIIIYDDGTVIIVDKDGKITRVP